MSWKLTEHAIERFQQRVRDLERPGTVDEMRRMLESAGKTRRPPEWLIGYEPQVGTHWRVYGDVAFLVRESNIVVTVLVRGGRDPGELRRRRALKRRRRALARRVPRPRPDRAPPLEESAMGGGYWRRWAV